MQAVTQLYHNTSLFNKRSDRHTSLPLQTAVPLYLVLVDLKAAKDTVRILTALQSAYPVAKSQEEQGVQELFGNVSSRKERECVCAHSTQPATLTPAHTPHSPMHIHTHTHR